jgi:hypothetical protein
MRRKWLLTSVLVFLFLGYACTQTLATPQNSDEPKLFISPFPPVEDPMAMIEEFARQTSVVQTEAADPSHLSSLDLTQTPSAFSADTKVLYVVFSYASRVSYSLSDLETLPQKTISVNGQEVKGVALLSVLERAGWGTQDAVAVSLNGIGSLTIPRERIREDFVLIPTGSSLRFVSPSIPEDMWIEGLTIIEVY